MQHLSPNLTVDLAQRSAAGPKPENQDAIGACLPEGRALATKGIALAIADGVSSSDLSKQASQIAVTGFLSDYYATPDTWSTPHAAQQVILSLNRYLWSQSQNSVFQGGYLTTFTALVLKGNTGFIFHVGDSRVYRLRGKELEQLTRDHVQTVDRETHYLSRALGSDMFVDIEMHSFEIYQEDIFLLTTDGIHNFLKPIFEEQTSPDILSSLFKHAIEQNSPDNLSAQVCKVIECGSSSQEDTVTTLSSLPFPPPLVSGQTLDGLTVKAILHESERSQVYLVEDDEGQQRVMKTPSPTYAEDIAYTERFVLESWIGQRILSPHVVKVMSPKQAPSFLYYLTRHIQGPTLSQLIEQSAPFEVNDAIELTEQIVRGLRAFHRKDTLHQDLKPGNVIVGKEGAVLIDFGSCWVAGITELSTPFMRDTILGTLDYSAPEYRIGTKRGIRSDQFSLGIILYEMLTKRKPYGEKFANALNAKHIQKLTYVPATKYNPLVPTWMDKAIEKAVNPRYDSRYSALSEFLLDLKRPNPNWIAPRDLPWIEKNPLRFWQTCAGLSWLITILTILMFWKN